MVIMGVEMTYVPDKILRLTALSRLWVTVLHKNAQTLISCVPRPCGSQPRWKRSLTEGQLGPDESLWLSSET